MASFENSDPWLQPHNPDDTHGPPLAVFLVPVDSSLRAVSCRATTASSKAFDADLARPVILRRSRRRSYGTRQTATPTAA